MSERDIIIRHPKGSESDAEKLASMVGIVDPEIHRIETTGIYAVTFAKNGVQITVSSRSRDSLIAELQRIS